MSWVTEEFSNLDLGDKRLNRHVMKMTEAFARQPPDSISVTCGGWVEAQAAYRFFADDQIDWRAILQPHWDSARARMAAQPEVLCLQDTTELDPNGQAITGLGRLSNPAQREMYPHPTYAVTPDREPLGVLDAWRWACADQASAQAVESPVESRRWSEGYERVAEQATALPSTRLEFMVDWESDILTLMQRAHALEHPADWRLRSQYNRALPDGGKLWETVAAGTASGTIRFTLHGRSGQSTRVVEQTLSARRIEPIAGLYTTCVSARGTRLPARVKLVELRLLSNRDGVDFAAAVQLIDWYRVRREIELLLHVVKDACRVEALRLSTLQRLERALALFLVVAWRIARLIRLERTCPDPPAELSFAADEWHSTYLLQKKPVRRHAPRPNPAIRLIATLGGFLGRKGNGEPGVKTLWLGLQRIAGFAAGAGLKYACGSCVMNCV